MPLSAHLRRSPLDRQRPHTRGALEQEQPLTDHIFDAGDVVQLKSGGPTMTVISANERSVGCVWFDKNHDMKQETLRPPVLKLAEKSKS
jgi:uncharacterized protein YodC (DUF2158 family)